VCLLWCELCGLDRLEDRGHQDHGEKELALLQRPEFEPTLYADAHSGSLSDHLFRPASGTLHRYVGGLDGIGMLRTDLVYGGAVGIFAVARCHCGTVAHAGRKGCLVDLFQRECEPGACELARADPFPCHIVGLGNVGSDDAYPLRYLCE